MRSVVIGLIAGLHVLLAADGSRGQSWTQSLFAKPHHDFGIVARASATEHVFEFTNRLNRDLHVRSVRSSCGCTSPSIQTHSLRPGEKGAVLAKLNTRSYKGNARATITVVFDRPYYAEAQLTVRAYIRRDVVLDPGSVEFGSVMQGQETERTINLQYAGRSDWAITGIEASEAFISAEAQETRRAYGRVGYDVVVKLASDAPPGYLQTELQILTNDQRLTSVPLPACGRVTPALTASPSSMLVGTLTPGQDTQLRLVVRAPQPFRVTDVRCDDNRFTFEVGDQKNTLHFIPVSFQATDSCGSFSAEIVIQSDFPGGFTATVTASGSVIAP